MLRIATPKKNNNNNIIIIKSADSPPFLKDSALGTRILGNDLFVRADGDRVLVASLDLHPSRVGDPLQGGCTTRRIRFYNNLE